MRPWRRERRSAGRAVRAAPSLPDDSDSVDAASSDLSGAAGGAGTGAGLPVPSWESSSSSSDSVGTGASRLRMGARHNASPGGSSSSVEANLPSSCFQFVINSGETVQLGPRDLHSFSPFAMDTYFSTHFPKACLCMPVLKAGKVFGVLYLGTKTRPLCARARWRGCAVEGSWMLVHIYSCFSLGTVFFL